MARTFTHNFIRDDGSPVTVEYSVEGSYSPTTYSPMSGACGGDAPEFTIEKVWPNTPEYEELHRRRQALTTDGYGRTLGPLVVSLMSAESREALEEIGKAIEAADTACALTDQERERIIDWLCENYIEEPDDDYEF